MFIYSSSIAAEINTWASFGILCYQYNIAGSVSYTLNLSPAEPGYALPLQTV